MTVIFARLTPSGSPRAKTPGLQKSSQSPQPLQSVESSSGNQAISSRGRRSLRFFGLFTQYSCLSTFRHQGNPKGLPLLHFMPFRVIRGTKIFVSSGQPRWIVPTLINILDEVLKLLFQRENNSSGGTNRQAPGTEHEALIRMPDNKFRAVDACRIWRSQLEYARFAENLAVAATVAKLRLYRWIPRNLLPWSEQTLPFFRRILFL